jgi:hypothetical protein
MTNHPDPRDPGGRRPLRLRPAALAAALILTAAVAGLALTRIRTGEPAHPQPADRADSPANEPRRDAAREAALARLGRADAARRRALDG